MKPVLYGHHLQIIALEEGFLEAIDIDKEGMMTVIIVREFSIIFDAYAQLEESMLTTKYKARQFHRSLS